MRQLEAVEQITVMEFRCIRQQRAIKTILTQPDAGDAFVYRVGIVDIG